MYRCYECGQIFEEPDYMEICWEDENGVRSMFEDRHYKVIAVCPYCQEYIDPEMDIYEDDEDEIDA